MEVKNLNAAKELVKKYRSITAADIMRAREVNPCTHPLKVITGFSDENACSLCQVVYCDNCIHYSHLIEEINRSCGSHITYRNLYKINDETTNEQILEMIAARADYLESLVTLVENN